MKRVTIIGAGPAGCAAAMALTAFPRVEVHLLEKERLPRRKVCGSGLSPWALVQLDRMGVGGMVRREAFVIRGARVGGAGGRVVELRGGLHAAVLLRERFDALLAGEARRRGAHLATGVRVDEIVRDGDRVVGLRTSEGELETDAVIVGNGAHSRLAPAARPGNRLHAILGWFEGVRGVSDAVELYFDPEFKPYYGWLFPESDRRVNIGLCYAQGSPGANARERFESFLERRFASRLAGADRIGPLVGHPIATTPRPTDLSSAGTLVAGEAGQLVDPATAEGIHHALASGTEAGEFLGEVLSAGREPTAPALAPFTRRVRARIGGRLRAGNWLLRTARTPILDLALQLGGWKPVRSLLTWSLSGA